MVERRNRNFDWSKRRIPRIVKSEKFIGATLFVIAVNSIWIGYAEDYLDDPDDATSVLIVENCFCALFTFEIVLRFLAYSGLQISGLKFQSLNSNSRELELTTLLGLVLGGGGGGSRLYRSQILQVNTRWKALLELYTMQSFAPSSNLHAFVKKC